MKIDIRTTTTDTPTTIKFADSSSYDYCAEEIQNKNEYSIDIVAEDGRCMSLDKKDVENLIKALQKAVELGWCKR